MTGDITHKARHACVESGKAFLTTNRRQQTIHISLYQLYLATLSPLWLYFIQAKQINRSSLLILKNKWIEIFLIKYLFVGRINNQVHVVGNTWNRHWSYHVEYWISLKMSNWDYLLKSNLEQIFYFTKYKTKPEIPPTADPVHQLFLSLCLLHHLIVTEFTLFTVLKFHCMFVCLSLHFQVVKVINHRNGNTFLGIHNSLKSLNIHWMHYVTHSI